MFHKGTNLAAMLFGIVAMQVMPGSLTPLLCSVFTDFLHIKKPAVWRVSGWLVKSYWALTGAGLAAGLACDVTAGMETRTNPTRWSVTTNARSMV